MTSPIEFTSRSPRFGLPLLYPGQAQKEFFINEAVSFTDLLLHAAIEGEENEPPVNVSEGECWLVGAAASGAWAGHEGQLASYQAGTWLFVPPRDGMRVLDRPNKQDRVFRGEWQRAKPIDAPAGGTMVDAEARAAIAQLIAALIAGGILPSN